MTESKQKTFDGKTVDSKDIKLIDKKEKCMYCGKNLKIIDGRHLSRCEKYLEYKEKVKRTQSSIINFCQEIKRKSYPIEQIFPNSWNVNSMTQEEFESLKESIQKTKGEFLKNNPIQIREIERGKYEIIDGEHRWRACMELKFTHIPAIVETNVDVEKAKSMTVISSKNRGRIDHFKFSKLLNEEYWIDINEAEKNEWVNKKEYRKCTYESLSNRFGETLSRIKNIMNIYRKLKNIYKSPHADFFSSRDLEDFARVQNDILREKTIDQAIKKEWKSKEIRENVDKMNNIFIYLLDNIKHDATRECILRLCTGASIFDLKLTELIEKISRLFIENERNNKQYEVIINYTRKFETHSRIARDHREEYTRKHGGNWDGWYKGSYIKTPKFTAAAEITWDFFQEYNRGIVNCFYCNKEISQFKDFIAHHEDYEWDYLWFIFLDLDQKIFPCCNNCHQPGNSKNWKSKK